MAMETYLNYPAIEELLRLDKEHVGQTVGEWNESWSKALDELRLLLANEKELRTALQFYSKKENYEITLEKGLELNVGWAIAEQGGLARNTLENL